MGEGQDSLGAAWIPIKELATLKTIKSLDIYSIYFNLYFID